MTVVPTQVNHLFLGVQAAYNGVRDMKHAVAFDRDGLGCTVVHAGGTLAFCCGL